jgi:hypothetical protein
LITTSITGTAAGLNGDTFQSPIFAGSFGTSFSYSNTVNTNDYTNTFGRSTNEVFYKFTLSAGMDITATHCGSSLSDTYMYLLDVNGNTIDFNDDYSSTGACSNSYHSIIKKTLSAGTYYIVSEGYGSNGSITTSITGALAANNTTGNTFQNPIITGTYGSSFQYSNSQNTANFTNTYGQSSSDVFYKFIISAPMSVTINHCGSSVSDTYLHLLNSSGTRITYNDDYSGTGCCSNTYHSYLKVSLAAGTYYVVSEGYSANGVIYTAISGQIESQQFAYAYDNSGNRISRQTSVSSRAMISMAGEKDGSGFDSTKDPGVDDSKDPEKGITTGNPDLMNEKLQAVVFPNPTEGMLKVNVVNYSEEKTGEIILFDIAGRVLLRHNIDSKSTIVDMVGYSSGIYMMAITLDGETVTHKIIRK